MGRVRHKVTNEDNEFTRGFMNVAYFIDRQKQDEAGRGGKQQKELKCLSHRIKKNKRTRYRMQYGTHLIQ